MMGRSELLAKLAQEAAAWDSGSGDISALLREAKDDIEHLASAAASHFQQAMLNGEAALAARTEAELLRKDGERYRWLRDKGSNTWVPFTGQWKMDAAHCDAAIDNEMATQRLFGAA